MKKCSIPGIFPHEGVYEFSTIHIHLSTTTENAVIHYTLDGSEPNQNSPVYKREEGLLPLKNTEDCHAYVVKAYAEAEGMLPSRTETFVYQFACRKKGSYRHTFLRERTKTEPAIVQIEDFDLDKMYLVIGTEKAILVDAGWDETGDLVTICRELIGETLPLELVVAHGHPDHIAHAGRFIDAGIRTWIPTTDRETAAEFVDVKLFDSPMVQDIKEGDILPLGNADLKVYTIPGHTPGGIVLVDESNGDVFASDEFGSSRRYVPDSAWLQLSGWSIEECLSTLKAFREKTKGKLKRIYSGHNDEPLPAELYLDTLQSAFQKVVDGGDTALQPSHRSAAESFGSGTACVEGDWRYDPIWAAANVKFIYENDRLVNPPRYAKGFKPNMKTEL